MPGTDLHGNDEVASTIEAIQMHWQIFTSVEVIAKRLHLPTSDVQHVIDHGCFPDRQLELNWTDIDEPAPTDSHSYNYEREGQR